MTVAAPATGHVAVVAIHFLLRCPSVLPQTRTSTRRLRRMPCTIGSAQRGGSGCPATTWAGPLTSSCRCSHPQGGCCATGAALLLCPAWPGHTFSLPPGGRHTQRCAACPALNPALPCCRAGCLTTPRSCSSSRSACASSRRQRPPRRRWWAGAPRLHRPLLSRRRAAAGGRPQRGRPLPERRVRRSRSRLRSQRRGQGLLARVAESAAGAGVGSSSSSSSSRRGRKARRTGLARRKRRHRGGAGCLQPSLPSRARRKRGQQRRRRRPRRSWRGRPAGWARRRRRRRPCPPRLSGTTTPPSSGWVPLQGEEGRPLQHAALREGERIEHACPSPAAGPKMTG